MLSRNEKLYIDLLKETSEIRDLVKRTSQYGSFLTYTDFTIQCNLKMLSNGIKPRQEFFQEIPQLKEECAKCWRFYLKPRTSLIKQYDVIYGKKFEEAFIKFLNKLTIHSDKADTKNKTLPDNLVLDKNGSTLAYYEVKYHNAPFIFRYKYAKGRECYEGSLTLDYDKVKKQIEAIRKITDLPVFFIHWIDFPCIKGIFCMTLEDTESILKGGVEFSRKKREGDYKINKKEKRIVGYTEKFYPSVLKMKNLEEFIKLLRSLYGKNS